MTDGIFFSKYTNDDVAPLRKASGIMYGLLFLREAIIIY